MVLDIFALIVFGVLIAVVIWLVVILGPIPGNIARKRGHPQADAINILGWFGLILGGLPWVAALVWANTLPADDASPAAERGTETPTKS